MYKPTSIDDYFSTLSKEDREIQEKLRKKIMKFVPQAEEYIGYGMPGFKYKGKPLIYFAVFKDHYSIFPTSSPIAKLEKELAKYATGKGTLQYPVSTEFPEDILKQLLLTRIEDIKSLPTKSGY